MSSIMNGLSSVVGSITNFKPMQKLGNKFIKNPEGALAAATVTSIVIKDGIGCAMYVTQSLNNKKIPDEKRKFVAALDLTNGVLMIAAQIAMFLAMRKYSGKIFDKIFKKSFNPDNKSNAITRFRMKASQIGETIYKKMKIGKDYESFKKSATDVFKFCLDIGAATIVGKRVIVPLIATPMAGKVEKWMNKDEEGQDTKQTDKKNATPTMKGTEKSVTEQQDAPKFDTGSTNLLDKYRK